MIAAELAEMGLTPPPETEAVVRRVIHTTADFDYAKNLRFTPGAVQKAVEALHKGAFLVTDTNMALAGITKPGLAKLGGQAACYMADPEVAALVIGVPVGFVNVVESKERLFVTCEAHGVPAIVAMGRKGGSNVAAAICNALIYSAAEMLDPTARGWNG